MITFRKPYDPDDMPMSDSQVRLSNLRDIKYAIEDCINSLREIAGVDAVQYADDVYSILKDVEQEIRYESDDDDDPFYNNNKWTAPISGNSIAGY